MMRKRELQRLLRREREVTSELIATLVTVQNADGLPRVVIGQDITGRYRWRVIDEDGDVDGDVTLATCVRSHRSAELAAAEASKVVRRRIDILAGK